MNIIRPPVPKNFESSAIDVGEPVEWMVDPNKQTVVLGVTYEFSLTGERKTVWYTPNKRRAKAFIVVRELAATGATSIED